MKVTPDNREEIIKKFENNQVTTRPDDARIVIAEMQLNALMQMSSDKNRIFSQIADSERWDVARALKFWEDPLPSCRARLKAKYDIDKIFKSDIVPAVIGEHLSLGHLVGRARVPEFIDGLKAVAPKNGFMQDEPQRKSILSRLI